MTSKELMEIEVQAYKKLNDTLHNARTSYVKTNSKFKVGDMIRSYVGIIKVEDIKYDTHMGSTRVMYCGYQYRHKDKQFVRTKNQELFFMIDYGNILKINQ